VTWSQAIGRRVAELRRARGLRQEDVAKVSGIIRPNVSRMESGKHLQSLGLLVRVAYTLGVKPSEILMVLDDVEYDVPRKPPKKIEPLILCCVYGCAARVMQRGKTTLCRTHRHLTVREIAALRPVGAK
jgi:transcriptional regulator with XRE-family HTH domain